MHVHAGGVRGGQVQHGKTCDKFMGLWESKIDPQQPWYQMAMARVLWYDNFPHLYCSSPDHLPEIAHCPRVPSDALSWYPGHTSCCDTSTWLHRSTPRVAGCKTVKLFIPHQTQLLLSLSIGSPFIKSEDYFQKVTACNQHGITRWNSSGVLFMSSWHYLIMRACIYIYIPCIDTHVQTSWKRVFP